LKSFSAHFIYDFQIQEIPETAQRVRAWIPIPESSEFQEVRRLKIQPQGGEIHRDPVYQNSIFYLEWKAPFTSPPAAALSFEIVRREKIAHPENTPLLDRYLQPDQLGAMDKARGIYDHVLRHMEYNKDAPGWGSGDTSRACAVGKGNCSDFHALFISMARAANIPARFHYGYSLKPGGEAGAHCWAEFHDDNLGWVPVDISEADKNPASADYYFGHLSEDRIQFSTGRDIVLDPPQSNGPLNFFINPYVEVDGRVHEKIHLLTRYTQPRSGSPSS
jgi:transglutaminase-like putative cysteine protease